jgi:uncharacterized membrane protein
MMRVKTLLVASLALNLFGGGLLISRYVLPPGWGPRPPAPQSQMPRGPQWVLSQLSDGERAKAEALFEKRGPQVRDLFTEVADARRAVGEALQRQPFDRDAFFAALADLKRREAAASAFILEDLSALAQDFSPAGREVLAKGLLDQPFGPGLRPRPPGPSGDPALAK